jgi:hypothetical protein
MTELMQFKIFVSLFLPSPKLLLLILDSTVQVQEDMEPETKPSGKPTTPRISNPHECTLYQTSEAETMCFTG